MIVNIHAAKTNLSKLIERAEAGEEIVIARNGKPAVKLTPVEAPPAKREKGSWLGSLRGQIWMADDFDAPNEEIGRLMEEGDVFPPDDEA
jgi:prevent-host-death family protein